MKRMKRLFATIMLTIGAAIPIGAIGVTTAHADSGDPYATGCASDAIGESTVNGAEGSVSLFYSPKCGTAWAEWTGCYMDVVYVHSTSGETGGAIAGLCQGYTAMVNDAGTLQAQGVGHSPNGGWISTGWF